MYNNEEMKMPAFLIFNKNGEISEKSTKCVTFDNEFFPEYEHYKRYNDYIILYNVENGSRNLTSFYFTDDKYTSDVAVLKTEALKIKNLTYKMYAKEMSKIKIEPNDYSDSDSESEIEDICPFTY
tara:strand:+ start:403 stop:777 length:375 start_codon:yes stop_codon:yes gene_type:complete